MGSASCRQFRKQTHKEIKRPLPADAGRGFLLLQLLLHNLHKDNEKREQDQRLDEGQSNK